MKRFPFLYEKKYLVRMQHLTLLLALLLAGSIGLPFVERMTPHAALARQSVPHALVIADFLPTFEVNRGKVGSD